MKYLFPLFAVAFLISCQVQIHEDADPHTQIVSDDVAEAIDAVFEDVKSDGPGGALAVVREGEIIYTKGYGQADLEHDIPITPKTVFYIGSVSKQFVTFSILQLVEEEKLDLDDDVREYIPEFPDYGVPLTIRHFIHHTSGVRDYLTLWNLAGYSYLDGVPKQGALDIICRQKELNFEPGSRYMYSNSCYFMLALIIERVTGQTMAAYGQEKIFGPLGMSSSRFHDDNSRLIEDRAFSYSWNEDESRWNNLISRFDLVGSGGIYSTVEDLYLWDQNLYQNQLGSQAMIDTMKTDGKLNDGSSAGYAFALVNETYRGLKTLNHSGSLAGYRAYFLQFPEPQTSVIILSNYGTFHPGRRAYEVADIVLEDMLGEEQSEEEPSSGSSTSGNEEAFTGDFFAPLSSLAGRYYSEELDTHYTLRSAEGGTLELVVRYLDPIPLVVAGEHLLQIDGGGVLEFEDPTSFRAQAGRVQNLLFKKVE